jgi:NAD(P)-dependent dehydrogenase (short-subunit alcohol dehydrogenase family)
VLLEQLCSLPRAGGSVTSSILIVGAGEATGGAVARRFAREGYIACVTRRNPDNLGPLAASIEAAGERAIPLALDARDETQVIATFRSIERDVAPLEVVVFHIGANVRFSTPDTTSRVFRKVWEMGCYAGFLIGREAARYLMPRGHGTVLFTEASASVRGREGFAAFAAARNGLRAVAQSMARELGPQGIHVGHVVVDGMIDTRFGAERFPELYARRHEGLIAQS